MIWSRTVDLTPFPARPRRAFLLVTVFLGLACGTILGLESRAVAFGLEAVMAEPEWHEWYTETEVCTGQRGDFDAIHWFRADSIRLDDGRWVVGVWENEPLRRIVVVHWAGARTFVHEMIHDLQDHANRLARFEDSHDDPWFGLCERDLSDNPLLLD